MMFDQNKSIIFWCKSQSNTAGEGRWSDSSTTGIYSKYESLQGSVISTQLLTSENMIPGGTFTSNSRSDLLQNYANYHNRLTSDPSAISMMFSFLVELMEHLESIGYTKNVYFLNHGVDATSLRDLETTFDWGNEKELFFESAKRFKEIVRYEQEVNGNNCQVISVWDGGESDATHNKSHIARVKELYKRICQVCGYEVPMYFGQIIPRTENLAAINQSFMDLADIKENVHVIGRDALTLPEQLAALDPDGIIDADDVASYTTADGFLAHWNWSAQILRGRIFSTDFLNTFLT